ncbi:hypothetical protein DPMN_102977 [Dreissena polymorpha]|uniref:Uncharacterized protein n=1 Tax=Dreissena polymorpha TaxID=45954 RepID=A0A9D4H5B4_DREPO|nr:hypothetical protein DPMN_102977 [Dreissena polymorpha]
MAILIRTLAVLLPSLDRVKPKYLKLVTCSSFSPFMVMSVLVLVVLFIASVGETLKFTAGATHEVNIISESQVGDWGSINANGDVVVLESLLHYLLKEKLNRTGYSRHT